MSKKPLVGLGVVGTKTETRFEPDDELQIVGAPPETNPSAYISLRGKGTNTTCLKAVASLLNNVLIISLVVL